MSEKHRLRKARFEELQKAKDRAADRDPRHKSSSFLSPERVFAPSRGDRNSETTRPNSPEYLHWRMACLVRDGHRCVSCNSTNRLEVDHIKPWSLYPGLRFDIANGRTLCHDCHAKTPTYGGKVKSIISVEVTNEVESTSSISPSTDVDPPQQQPYPDYSPGFNWKTFDEKR